MNRLRIVKLQTRRNLLLESIVGCKTHVSTCRDIVAPIYQYNIVAKTKE
jgi:hypothetical protein